MSEVVKIDPNLLKKVKKVIRGKTMRIKYSNVKQFINIAVLDKLEKEDKLSEKD